MLNKYLFVFSFSTLQNNSVAMAMQQFYSFEKEKSKVVFFVSFLNSFGISQIRCNLSEKLDISSVEKDLFPFCNGIIKKTILIPFLIAGR